MNPRAKPKHPVPCDLSPEDLSLLRQIGTQVRPVVRIGAKEKLSIQIVAKTNRHLASEQIIKVEFVKLTNQEVHAFSKVLAEQTGSQLLEIHGSFAIFFRKHPNGSLDELYRKFSI